MNCRSYVRAANCSNQYGIYMHLHVCEDVVQIMYTPLEASAVRIRKVRGCTPIHDRLMVQQYSTYNCSIGVNLALLHMCSSEKRMFFNCPVQTSEMMTQP